MMLIPSPLPQPLFSLLSSLQLEQTLRTRARGRTVKIPCVQPGLVESTASGTVPGTWPGWDGHGALDMLGKAGFGQKPAITAGSLCKQCRTSWFFPCLHVAPCPHPDFQWEHSPVGAAGELWVDAQRSASPLLLLAKP